MKKYLLLFLFTFLTTVANATTDYAEVTATATIEVAEVIQCENSVLNFGDLAIKSGNKASTVTVGSTTSSTGDVIATKNTSTATCSDSTLDWDSVGDVTLTSKDTTDTLTMSNIGLDGNNNVTATLYIPENTDSGTYTGTFTVTGVK
ncbi:MAG: hypothetical protein E7016_05770 [Alphaproteobacteria bacterium]|nr:hypothetical protein [Alphaproteobacteria bacterium]